MCSHDKAITVNRVVMIEVREGMSEVTRFVDIGLPGKSTLSDTRYVSLTLFACFAHSR